MKRNKVLLITLVSGLVLIGYVADGRMAEGHAVSGQEEQATPVRTGQMTDQQREHSKLYKKYNSHATIPERLKSEKGAIDFYKLSPMGAELEGVPVLTAGETIWRVTCSSDAVIVGSVSSKSSQINEDQTFLFTDYELSVEEVLKNNNSAPILPNSKITVTRPGGVVLLEGRTIRALDQSFQPLKRGERYLLFLDYLPKTGTYRSIETGESFHLKDDKIKEFKEGSPSWLESSFTPFSLMTEIRAAVGAECDKRQGVK